jgi:PAS domain S-box-containing protein
MSESAKPPKCFPGSPSPFQITAIYALVSALWIPITDQLLVAWISDMVMLTLIQTLKGGIFVLGTAALLYLLIRRSTRRLREEHVQLTAVIEGTSDMVFIKDLQGRYRLVNTAFARMLGRSAKEIIVRDDNELFTPDIAARLREVDRQVIAHSEHQTVEEAVTVAGITRIYSTTKIPYQDAKGRIVGVIGIAQDISERKQAEMALTSAHYELEQRIQERTAELIKINEVLQAEITERRQAEAALRESEERFRQLVEHLDEIFWMANADGSQVLYVSPAYEKVRGHSCQHIYEHPTDWLDAIHPEDRARLQDIHARITVGEFSEEYRIIRPDGTVRWIWSRGFPIRDTAGHIYRIAGIGQDITERRQAEDKARQQQAELAHMARFALASEMASGLAHELNQPLGAITTYIEACLLLIRSGQTKSETLLESMEKAAAQAQRAGEIIQRLRNLMRKTEPHRSEVNINELIQEVIHLVEPEARQQEVQIRLELDENLPLLTNGAS